MNVFCTSRGSGEFGEREVGQCDNCSEIEVSKKSTRKTEGVKTVGTRPVLRIGEHGEDRC